MWCVSSCLLRRRSGWVIPLAHLLESASWATAAIRAKILTMAEFVTIRRGWFLMGSDEGQEAERPVRRVWVDAFEMGVYPVTRAEYAVFLEDTGYEQPREWNNPVFGQPDQPVVGINWDDTQAYCAWRSRRNNAVRLQLHALAYNLGNFLRTLAFVRMLARSAARECFAAAPTSPQPASASTSIDHTPLSSDEGSNHGH